MLKILLVEPSYKNKYPPLGLMKISTFHKKRGDIVFFVKGNNSSIKKEKWDRIYLSSLFTFNWETTIKCIEYYYNSVENHKNIFVGGVMATLMKDQILQEFSDITILSGLLNRKNQIFLKGEEKIDSMLPDYDIVNKDKNLLLDYEYPTTNSYIIYATRGCIRRCDFCAVHRIEPEFNHYIPIKQKIKEIKKEYGEKKHLLLLDNNVLASSRFSQIIDDIISLGYTKQVKVGKKLIDNKKTVDFNQGIDARLLDEKKIKKLSQISIKPLRIAFDDIKFKDIYVEKVRLAAKYKIKTLSNYILFNFNDTIEDFYDRLKVNIDLNEEFESKGLKSKIWSFPMKYSPLFGEYAKNRKFVGEHWNRKYLRGIQCILNATHGVVGPKRAFFEKAFGQNIEEFKEIVILPEKYIINRVQNEFNIEQLLNKIRNLNENEKQLFYNIIKTNNLSDINLNCYSYRLKQIFKEYL